MEIKYEANEKGTLITDCPCGRKVQYGDKAPEPVLVADLHCQIRCFHFLSRDKKSQIVICDGKIIEEARS